MISNIVFTKLFSNGVHLPYEVVKDALPDDTKIIDVRINRFSEMVEFLLESDEFEGETIPELSPTIVEVKYGG